MRFVDLTAPITQSPAETPDGLRTDIEFHDHAHGAAQIEGLLGVPARLLRDGEGWATETVTHLGTHTTTHVDAPCQLQQQRAHQVGGQRLRRRWWLLAQVHPRHVVQPDAIGGRVRPRGFQRGQLVVDRRDRAEAEPGSRDR